AHRIDRELRHRHLPLGFGARLSRAGNVDPHHALGLYQVAKREIATRLQAAFELRMIVLDLDGLLGTNQVVTIVADNHMLDGVADLASQRDLVLVTGVATHAHDAHGVTALLPLHSRLGDGVGRYD